MNNRTFFFKFPQCIAEISKNKKICHCLYLCDFQLKLPFFSDYTIYTSTTATLVITLQGHDERKSLQHLLGCFDTKIFTFLVYVES